MMVPSDMDDILFLMEDGHIGQNIFQSSRHVKLSRKSHKHYLKQKKHRPHRTFQRNPSQELLHQARQFYHEKQEQNP